MSAQVAADLRAAADLIEARGWTQGRYIAEDGCRCALGALIGVVDPRARRWSVLSRDDMLRVEQNEDALGRHVVDSVIAWNDTPGRTADEVIAALRAAADRAEAQQ